MDYNLNGQGVTFGSLWMHRQLIRLMRYVPVEVFYCFTAIFIVPVCLVVNPAQRIIYRYFRDCHNVSPVKATLMTYRNFYLFAQVVIDRFAMYSGRHFDVDVEGYEHFQQLAEREEGFVQLSAHVGNYEIAGYTLVADKKRFNALVFDKEKATVMENRSKLFATTNIRMIAVKQDMSHLFVINEALAEGETVSMPADRMLGSTKSVVMTFLGKEAAFPLGPFAVATMRGLDVLAVNVMKTDTKRYRIYVTPLRYDKDKPRAEQTTQLARAYADELERILRIYPEQWYNYFSFWK